MKKKPERQNKRVWQLGLLGVILFSSIFFNGLLNVNLEPGDSIIEEDEVIDENLKDILEEPKPSSGEIQIVTPENKTYYGPMEGYYPGTWSFDNDKINSEPYDWSVSFGSSSEVHVVDEY